MTSAHAAASAMADGQAALRLHLRGLRKRFGACIALDGIELTVEGPGMLGVVGPDGAGKTTLLRVLAGLLEFEADAADSMGFDLLGDVQQYKRRIGSLIVAVRVANNSTSPDLSHQGFRLNVSCIMYPCVFACIVDCHQVPTRFRRIRFCLRP